MTERIEGLVAGIMSDQRLIINRGEDDGVFVGMQFAILSDQKIMITDPKSGEELGSEPVAKTVVKVISVKPRHSIARTFRTRKTPGLLEAFGTGPTERHEKLQTEEPSALDHLKDANRVVASGDTALEVLGQEFDGIVLGF